MRPLIFILLSLLFSQSPTLHAQEVFRFRGWSDSIVMMANTGADSEFLTEDEKKVIVLSNLARIDGYRFSQTILKEYLTLKQMKSNRYINSLIRELQNIKNLPLLIPEKDLYDVARDHATNAGVKDFEGHKGFDKRYAQLKKKYMHVGENIFYGDYTPVEIVLQLLIDEGIKDLGHRKNALAEDFNSIGVSIKPHKSYKYNCVMSFGLIPRSYKDYIQ